MTPQEIKEYIYNNEKVEYILEKLNMQHIILHRSNEIYYSCGMPDGDNIKSTIIYINSYLNVTAYTRDIKDKYGKSDIISLICFIKKMYFSQALKWICEQLGLDYYNDITKEMPKSLQITKMLLLMKSYGNDIEDEKLKPINEKVLSYYYNYVNDLFKNDGINYMTQKEFEIGFDGQSNRITIPIRDELGTLVGVKGRIFKENLDEEDQKYIYLEPCAKTKICYGLYKTLKYIQQKQKVIIVESEKSVMKLWQEGIYNCIAIGGHDLSRIQVEKITRLAVKEVIICYDEDVSRNKDKTINYDYYKKEINKFIPQQYISVIIDKNRTILNEKESPADDIEKFNKLYNLRINKNDILNK